MRDALSFAINRDELGRTFFYGKLQYTTPPGQLLTQPEIDNAYWKEEASKFYRYDPEEAQRLMKEAGYAQGFNIKLYSYSEPGATYIPKLNEVLQGYFQKVGIKCELVPIDRGTYQKMRRSGPNKGPADELVGQMAVVTTTGNPVPARSLTSRFHSSGSPYLLTGAPFAAELDSLIMDSLSQPSVAKRSEMEAKALRLVVDSRVAPVIGRVPGMVGLGPRVDIEFPSESISVPLHVEDAKHRTQ